MLNAAKVINSVDMLNATESERNNYWSAMSVVNGYNVHSDGTLTKKTIALSKADPSTY